MAERKLSLGLFMPNCSNMPSISTTNVVPDQWTFEHNKQLAQAAESAGFEYLFPVSRWRGFGGETNFLGTSLETITWATAILQSTQRINVFSTVHVPLFHPFVVMADSQDEAEGVLAEIIAGKDAVATQNWLHDLTAGSGSFDTFTENMLASSGGGVHILGTPERVAEQLEQAFVSGVDAVMLTFPRYAEGLAAFNARVLPLLQSKGIA